MLSLETGTEPQFQRMSTVDQQLTISIANISKIMQRINQTVRKSQSDFQQAPCPPLTADDQNLLTEENDDNFLRNFKQKMHAMKIPLHLVHRKNKLSTVIEESHSQSGRTYNAVTPRDLNIEFAKQSFKEEQAVPEEKVLTNQQCNFVDTKHKDWIKKPKKIQGIRRAAVSVLQTPDNTKTDPKPTSANNKILSKVKSLTSFKNFKAIQPFVLNTKQQENIENMTVGALKSKVRKGLSVLSKSQSTKDLERRALASLANNISNISKNISTVNPSQQVSRQASAKKQQTLNSAKTKKVSSFVMPKKKSSTLSEKDSTKVSADSKPKNCLTRINSRDFFMSKRIHK